LPIADFEKLELIMSMRIGSGRQMPVVGISQSSTLIAVPAMGIDNENDQVS
jgi:hypothetical protein